MGDRDDAGSPLAAEAARLAAAVQEWARENFPAPADGPGPDCQWCPICQFMAVLRGERPELTERVTEAGAALGSALRSVFDAASAMPGHRPESRPRPSPRVQHIDLDRSDP